MRCVSTPGGSRRRERRISRGHGRDGFAQVRNHRRGRAASSTALLYAEAWLTIGALAVTAVTHRPVPGWQPLPLQFVHNSWDAESLADPAICFGQLEIDDYLQIAARLWTVALASAPEEIAEEIAK